MDQESSAPMTTGKLQDIGDLLRSAKDIVIKRKEFFIPIALVPSLVQYFSAVFADSILGLPLAGLLTLVGIILSIAAAIAIVNGLADEKMTDWMGAYKSSVSQFGSYLFVAILVGIVTIVGYFLLIIPGIIASVIFLFASFYNILEGKKGWKAAQSSQELAKGYFWPLLGRFLAYVVVVIIYAVIVGMVFGLLGRGNVWVTALGSLVISTTLTPFAITYIYLMYKRLKELKPSVPKPQM